MIEAQADIRTSDGYLLRVFCIGFTMKMRGQIKKTAYAQHTQVSRRVIFQVENVHSCESSFRLKLSVRKWSKS